jgi:hypothetical protein
LRDKIKLPAAKVGELGVKKNENGKVHRSSEEGTINWFQLIFVGPCFKKGDIYNSIHVMLD